jgi:[methyl-Co(III) methanol-specific corrinoid protein]:coenzyme M methyltransferase
MISPPVMKERSEDWFAIMGNVNPATLLGGGHAEIGSEVIANLEAGVDIISPGCAVSPECPNANLAFMASTVKTWRKSNQ